MPLIERACADGNVAGLVLHITSPGGAPSEAERMAAALKIASQHGKVKASSGQLSISISDKVIHHPLVVAV